MTVDVEVGDIVIARGTTVEMRVESIAWTETPPGPRQIHSVICAWPIPANEDEQPLRRDSFSPNTLRVLAGERNGQALDVDRPTLGDLFSRAKPERRIDDDVLDAMERDGWTPAQVRALIADYRDLTRSKGG